MDYNCGVDKVRGRLSGVGQVGQERGGKGEPTLVQTTNALDFRRAVGSNEMHFLGEEQAVSNL